LKAASTVSVIMPVYNSAKYLEEAMESVLEQTFRDFEFIIVDDGSTDGSSDILQRYAKLDSRIRILSQENKGISASRNRAMENAAGKYIALMDSDDISLPDRLARQMAFMEAHPEVGVCGVRCSFFGDKGEFVGVCPPSDPKQLKCRMLFLITISNTCVMMRRDLLVAHGIRYDSSLDVTEDYELLSRLLPRCEIANIPEVLMKIRTHSSSITRRRPQEEHFRSISEVHKRLLPILGIEPSDQELQMHLSLCTHDFPPESREDVDALEHWLCRLVEANNRAKVFDEKALAVELSDRWYSACFRASGLGWWVWEKFSQSQLLAAAKPPLRYRVVLALVCLLKLRAGLAIRVWRSEALDSFALSRFLKQVMRRLVVIH